MNIPDQQAPPIEERIGSMVGKIIVLALCAMLLWGYSKQPSWLRSDYSDW
jgi:hypothetical protein